jgi:hypothetical protein
MLVEASRSFLDQSSRENLGDLEVGVPALFECAFQLPEFEAGGNSHIIEDGTCLLLFSIMSRFECDDRRRSGMCTTHVGVIGNA